MHIVASICEGESGDLLTTEETFFFGALKPSPHDDDVQEEGSSDTKSLGTQDETEPMDLTVSQKTEI